MIGCELLNKVTWTELMQSIVIQGHLGKSHGRKSAISQRLPSTRGGQLCQGISLSQSESVVVCSPCLPESGAKRKVVAAAT